jgi:hypothetical protein
MEKEINKNNNLRDKNFLSTGNLFLDKIIGGVSLGTIVLLVEDSPSQIYESFMKLFIAEGVVNDQKVFYYYSDDKNSAILKNLPYKSTQVDSILNSKRVNESHKSNSSEMKIAWRYENIQYSNLLDDILKSTNYIFDLSRQLQDIYVTEKKKNLIMERKISSTSSCEILDEFYRSVIRDYQSYANSFIEEEKEFKNCRIIFPNLLSDDFMLNKEISSKEINQIKMRLLILKNLARSINGVVYLTVNKEFMSSKIFNLFFYFSDYVFTLKSFLLDPQRLQDYDALFYVRKLPRICAFKPFEQMETDTYGVIVDKRKVIIEKIDIGVEVDRNTKVKENEVSASQAMCGQEKYSKNFEF